MLIRVQKVDPSILGIEERIKGYNLNNNRSNDFKVRDQLTNPHLLWVLFIAYNDTFIHSPTDVYVRHYEMPASVETITINPMAACVKGFIPEQFHPNIVATRTKFHFDESVKRKHIALKR